MVPCLSQQVNVQSNWFRQLCSYVQLRSSGLQCACERDLSDTQTDLFLAREVFSEALLLLYYAYSTSSTPGPVQENNRSPPRSLESVNKLVVDENSLQWAVQLKKEEKMSTVSLMALFPTGCCITAQVYFLSTHSSREVIQRLQYSQYSVDNTHQTNAQTGHTTPSWAGWYTTVSYVSSAVSACEIKFPNMQQIQGGDR